MLCSLDFLLDLPHVDTRDRINSIKDTGDLLKRRALGLDVEEEDEDKLEEVPQL